MRLGDGDFHSFHHPSVLQLHHHQETKMVLLYLMPYYLLSTVLKSMHHLISYNLGQVIVIPTSTEGHREWVPLPCSPS